MDKLLQKLKESWNLIEKNDAAFNQGIPVPFNKKKKVKEEFEVGQKVLFKLRGKLPIEATIINKEYDDRVKEVVYDLDVGKWAYERQLTLSDSEMKESKRDGPTKKASSSRDDKKWMQCVRQPDGSYKRVHWGQPGVRVTGKSGDTKRKKSFRARHKCDKAKKGSAQAQACKDW